ncbi:MAG: MetQ/NlpA family ABC transporter substrate-binding protein [Collimonas sp.]|uniref:MetQ/NlpA family ABC transporter substrate-binding protein n=1 Tax=Collimonas sp. TaxID=1963772 RepID=UPI003267B1DD
MLIITLQPAVAEDIIRIGVTPGVYAEILEQVKNVAVAQDLKLNIVVFDDKTRIDEALAQHKIDAASFEDGPSFAANRQRYALANAGSTVTLPMAIYSRQLSNLTQLQRGASIAIPADAAGAARALVLLQNFTLLTFADRAGLHAKLADITSNRLGLKIRQLPRERLYAALDKVAFAVIDSNDAARAGLYPARDSLGIEDARSPWQGVLAVREADRAQPWVAQLVKACHSDTVAHFILTHYQDSVRRPW